MTKPNIIFILADDHAPHAISAYGSRVNRTPHIDRIAHEGALLKSLFCTNSICTPSRASILTGTYTHVNGTPGIFAEFDYRVPTFVAGLREHGYTTALYGKWHLGESASARPRDFDDWLVFPGQGAYVDPDMIGPDGKRAMRGYATDIVTDLALDWMAQRDTAQPFALFIHHKAPHAPWIPDDRHLDLYPVGSIPEPETLHDDHRTLGSWSDRTTMSIADDLHERHVKEPLPPELEGPDRREERASWKYQRYMSDYLQVIQAIDDNVGRVLDRLDTTGDAQNTIVVYMSDQGFFLGDHGWYDKRLMFEQSLQMPALIRWPAEIAPGGVVSDILTNVDIAGTLLELCGIDVASSLPVSQGRSFAAQLRGETVPDWPDAMYYRYWEHDDPNHHVPAHYGIRTRTHKLICYYNDPLGVPGSSDRRFPVEWELYDLEEDPQELRNVISDPNRADIVAHLRHRLARLQEHYGDTPYSGPDTTHPDWGAGIQEFSQSPR
ncbi:sulfatase [Microbacterium sp. ARD32]|uniref:sulfatase family protein n=1 Tax=Microbacterium sp. ARD32 TaxID=2962577 RepID=UPI002881F12B|nr:sulfatase [Microbacterium sp. ARD32]MDT0158228.1 sulfatase [Microbacterium sp. ARD32]